MKLSLETQIFMAKREAEQIGKYYYKRFGATISTVLASADTYIMLLEKEKTEAQSQELLTKKEEKKTLAYNSFSDIEKHYRKIPFEDLGRKEQFYPLFVVKKILPKIKSGMDDIFLKNNTIQYELLQRRINTVKDIGDVYEGHMLDAIKEVQKHPGLENYTLEINDNTGNKYNFGI